MALSKPGSKPLQELNGKTEWCVEGMKKTIEAVVTQCSALPARVTVPQYPQIVGVATRP